MADTTPAWPAHLYRAALEGCSALGCFLPLLRQGAGPGRQSVLGAGAGQHSNQHTRKCQRAVVQHSAPHCTGMPGADRLPTCALPTTHPPACTAPSFSDSPAPVGKPYCPSTTNDAPPPRLGAAAAEQGCRPADHSRLTAELDAISDKVRRGHEGWLRSTPAPSLSAS